VFWDENFGALGDGGACDATPWKTRSGATEPWRTAGDTQTISRGTSASAGCAAMGDTVPNAHDKLRPGSYVIGLKVPRSPERRRTDSTDPPTATVMETPPALEP
jgi:hypothetical protein|tara:strand:+ start:1060 stop:1371 length:312 start_codon:yes stop_codon:yes gene_type:complete